MTDKQTGFRKDRSTIQQILMVILIAKKAKRKNIIKAFDSVKQEIIWTTLRSFGLQETLVQSQSHQNAGEQSKAAVKVCNELGEWFNISSGTKQGKPS